jgi:hypothetical protein
MALIKIFSLVVSGPLAVVFKHYYVNTIIILCYLYISSIRFKKSPLLKDLLQHICYNPSYSSILNVSSRYKGQIFHSRIAQIINREFREVKNSKRFPSRSIQREEFLKVFPFEDTWEISLSYYSQTKCAYEKLILRDTET